jgi:hypothetical protein
MKFTNSEPFKEPKKLFILKKTILTLFRVTKVRLEKL